MIPTQCDHSNDLGAVVDDLGGRTDDLITSRQDHPDEPDQQKPGIPNRERINRRYGRSLMIVGLSLLAGTTLTVALIPDRITDKAPSLVTMTVVHDCLLLGTAGILASLLEMLSRYNRHLARKTLHQQAAVQEQIDVMVGLLSAVSQRLAAAEHGLESLVKALPDGIQKQYWAGFNDAVREGFEATGTADGTPKHRPGHLGLVPRSDANSDKS